MKKSSCYKWMLSMCIAVMASIGVQAQNFHSKPTAIENLASESKYITATLPSFSESDVEQYERLAEKQRVILKILHSIKKGNSVEQAVNSNVAAQKSTQITTAIKNFQLPEGHKSRTTWMRSEILKLVSY